MYADSIRDRPHRLVASDRVEGARLLNADGKKIGHIKRLMIDKLSGNVAYAVVCFGGFLGIGEEYFPLPWSSMKYNPSVEAYELMTLMSEEELAKAPSYGANKDFDWGNRIREVDAYWIGF
jgi:hypothetical protein